MGIFGAMTTAVGGLQAQSFALENISGNIANSQTTGFKRVDTSFADMVASSSAKRQTAGGVTALSRQTNNVQGDIQTAGVDTFMAIKGDGYFVVQKPAGFPDGQPTFVGVDLYTRRGDFELDKNGYLVNGSGYYLKALRIDSITGNTIGSVPEVLQFTNDFLPSQTTTIIEYRANLASMPRTQAYTAAPDTPGSELIDPGAFSGSNPLDAGDGTVEGADVGVFLEQSIAGGAITVYDSLGNEMNVQMRWVKTDSAATGGTDTWEMFYLENSNAGNTDVAWRNAGQVYSFNASGILDPNIPAVTISNLTIDGVVIGNVVLSHGASGVTQFADSNGVAKVNLLNQNGYAAGELQSIAVSDKGRIVASYSNGRAIDIAEIPLASFLGDNALKRLDGGAFEATSESGPAIFGASGTIVGKSLEGSNTDIADEFTKLIVTQQAYAANTRIVTTADQMLQETINMIR
ncbi:MAG: flagellar hook-basal body complex protein [Xanthobacteraceae bacterium]|nr:flagellar hook-basal body complex protein [Xanthobacteraceae bacterium]QYK44084.1 MAG: flagellar hook-basal body complex protein [Xanthobacteraceae bacterium]